MNRDSDGITNSRSIKKNWAYHDNSCTTLLEFYEFCVGRLKICNDTLLWYIHDVAPCTTSLLKQKKKQIIKNSSRDAIMLALLWSNCEVGHIFPSHTMTGVCQYMQITEAWNCSQLQYAINLIKKRPRCWGDDKQRAICMYYLLLFQFNLY